MPFRLADQGFPNRAKIQFTTSLAMPHQIYLACQRTGVVSNTVYCQLALVEALSRDLGIPVEVLLDDLPPARGRSKHLYNPATDYPQHRGVHLDQSGGRVMTGPGNTDENVR